MSKVRDWHQGQDTCSMLKRWRKNWVSTQSCRQQQEQQRRQEAAADSFHAALLNRRALFAWRQSHGRLQQLQARALALWTAGSRRGAFGAWRTLLQERKLVIGRLAASAAANTPSSSFNVRPAGRLLDEAHLLICQAPSL